MFDGTSVSRYKIGTRGPRETTKTIYKRNSAGRIIAARSYRRGALIQKRRYSYDARGNQVEEAFYGPDGKLQYKLVSVYDSDGNKIGNRSLDSGGLLKSKSVYTYDGEKISSASSFKDCVNTEDCKVMEYKIVNTYDDSDRLIESVAHKSDGSIDEIRRYTYHANGLEKQMTVHDRSGTVTRRENYDYEHDAKGNWIKKVITPIVNKDGLVNEQAHVTKRTITNYSEDDRKKG